MTMYAGWREVICHPSCPQIGWETQTLCPKPSPGQCWGSSRYEHWLRDELSPDRKRQPRLPSSAPVWTDSPVTGTGWVHTLRYRGGVHLLRS